jgi:hypothetical protein
MPVLIEHPEEKVVSYVFDIFLWLARACDVSGIDLATVPRYEDASAQLEAIDLDSVIDDEARAKLVEVRTHYSIDYP